MKLVITDSRKVSQFSSILKSLKNFSLDIEIHVDGERLYAQGMDSSHCCLFELELLSDWFSEYDCEDAVRLGVHCELLAKIFNCMSDNQNIQLDYTKDTDSLYITLSPKEGESGIVKEFKLPLMNIESQLMEIPDTDYTADIHMISSDFTDLVTQLSMFGNEIQVKCSDEIRFTGKGEMGSMDAVIKEEDILYYGYMFYQTVMEDVELLYEEGADAVEMEIDWGISCIGEGILGLTPETLREYIQFIGDIRLQSIGLPKHFN